MGGGGGKYINIKKEREEERLFWILSERLENIFVLEKSALSVLR